MDFWQEHGIFFLIFMTFFPRLTMLLATAVHFGLLSWLGWFFAPYLTVAILATEYYWHTNPILCIIAWFIALAGTGSECKMIHSGGQRRRWWS